MGQLFDRMTAGLPPNPNRAANWIAVGSGLSQLAQGGPVDLSQHHARIQQRNDQQEERKGLTGAIESLKEELGPERYKALLGAPPAIQKAIIAQWYQQRFSGPAKPQFISGPNGAQYRVVTGADGNVSYELAIPGEEQGGKPKDNIITVDGRAYFIGEPGADGVPTMTPVTPDNTKPDTPNSWDEFVMGMPSGMSEDQLKAEYHNWLMARARAGGGLGPNIGALGPGEIAIEDPTVEGGYRIVLMPGGKAAREAEEAAAAAAAIEAGQASATRSTIRTNDIVTNAIEQARVILESDSRLNPATGFGSGIAENIRGSNAAILREVLKPIISNNALNELRRMKEASPTGASGFGQLNLRELELLEAKVASLSQSANEEILLRNLKIIEEDYKHMMEPVWASLEAGEGFTGSYAAPGKTFDRNDVTTWSDEYLRAVEAGQVE